MADEWRPDWRDPSDYSFADALTAQQWGWEFLRRNREYQTDWDWFIGNWRALEADYGKAPNRDFPRWKQDPRAYVLEGSDQDCTGGEGCRVDGDKILIECWMGAKWGFYKFPVDPAQDHPQVPEQLLWRDRPVRAFPLDEQDREYVSRTAGRVAMGFDLTLPLKEQLEAAKRYLLGAQHRLRREAVVAMKTVSNYRDGWIRCLRLLDGERCGAGEDELSGVVGGGSDPGAIPDLGDYAHRLRDGGYLDIVDWPER